VAGSVQKVAIARRATVRRKGLRRLPAELILRQPQDDKIVFTKLHSESVLPGASFGESNPQRLKMTRRSSLTWKFERELRREGMAVVAGVDEVGRGCWAGPVFAAAAILPDGLKHEFLHDSKMLKAECRAELNAFLRRHPEVRWSVGIATVEEIETHNILRASLLAMRRATEGLPVQPHLCLIDGNQKAGLACREVTVIAGDSRCPSIAAASVIAKVARDLAMAELAVLYPGYGLENHKGYGTPEHARALTLHGPCPIHRRTFKPIREYARAQAGDRGGDRKLW
jgi:ribonuclease HII